MKYSRELYEIAQLIGQFYLEKNGGDYNKTEEELLCLQVFDLELVDDKLVVHTARPGLFIGPRGENMGKLGEFIGKFIHIKEVPSPLDLMVPEDPDAWPDDYMYELGNLPDLED